MIQRVRIDLDHTREELGIEEKRLDIIPNEVLNTEIENKLDDADAEYITRLAKDIATKTVNFEGKEYSLTEEQVSSHRDFLNNVLIINIRSRSKARKILISRIGALFAEKPRDETSFYNTMAEIIELESLIRIYPSLE
jgi:hypothetical protein